MTPFWEILLQIHFCCVYFKSVCVCVWVGASGGKDHIFPFRSLEIFTCFDGMWWQLPLRTPHYTIPNLGVLVLHSVLCSTSCTFCPLFCREIHGSVSAPGVRCPCFRLKPGWSTWKYMQRQVCLLLLFPFKGVLSEYKEDSVRTYCSSAWQPCRVVNILRNVFRSEWIAIDLRWSFVTVIKSGTSVPFQWTTFIITVNPLVTVCYHPGIFCLFAILLCDWD